MNGRYSGIGTVCPESSSLSKTHPPKPAVKCLDRGRILGQGAAVSGQLSIDTRLHCAFAPALFLAHSPSQYPRRNCGLLLYNPGFQSKWTIHLVMVRGDLMRIGMTPIILQQHLQLEARSQIVHKRNWKGVLSFQPSVVRRLKLVTAYSREILCISPQAPYDSIQSCLISVLSDEAVRLSVYSGNSAGSAPIG
ncbi:hypothetical protein BN1723_005289 [Verticillium longisporum]|uniref:Uncharacterized protein n=1 Tax=Verticillium longisporum TaxID=100787 RepID=A0A0G4N6Z8_VERLO|nr:hypothetical protein BN1723_005289 [Verticillium longisporum]